jgi:hypothetical protein
VCVLWFVCVGVSIGVFCGWGVTLCVFGVCVVVGVSRELGPRSVAFSVHHVHPFLQLGVVEECRR